VAETQTRATHFYFYIPGRLGITNCKPHNNLKRHTKFWLHLPWPMWSTFFQWC